MRSMALAAGAAGAALASVVLMPTAAGQDAEGESTQVQADEPLGEGRVVIEGGHVDIAPRFVDDEWTVMIRDDTVEPSLWRELSDVVLRVPDAATVQAPDDPDFAFLGEPGDDVWVIPQVQDPDVVWPGWNTNEPEVATTVDREVTWSLLGVEGPGDFVLFVNEAFGVPTVLFDNQQPYPQETGIEVYTHAHGNWAFTEPGVYLLDVEMSATTVDGDGVGGTGTVQLAVGGGTDPDEAFAAGEDHEPATVAEPPGSPEGGEAAEAHGDEGTGIATDPSGEEDSTSSGPWVLVGAGALALIVVGAMSLLWARTRRRRGSPGPDGSDATDPGREAVESPATGAGAAGGDAGPSGSDS